MKYQGLLTDVQKRAGYFVTQDEDFIFLWRGDKKKTGEEPENPYVVAMFLYDTATIKQIREVADKDK